MAWIFAGTMENGGEEGETGFSCALFPRPPAEETHLLSVAAPTPSRTEAADF